MKPSEAIVQQSDTIKAAAKKFGYANLRVFGNISKGLDTEGSILYILSDPQTNVSPLAQTKLERELTQALQMPVIILKEDKLPQHMASEVAKGTLPI